MFICCCCCCCCFDYLSIDFEWNLFGDEGAKAIGEMLKRSSRVDTGYFFNQFISPIGVDAILAPMAVRGGLAHFGLGVIRNENMDAVTAMIESNSAVVELVLDFDFNVDFARLFRSSKFECESFLYFITQKCF